VSVIAETADRVLPADASLLATARRHLDNLTKPRGSLGRLEDLAARLVAITRRDPPVVRDKRLFVFSADHGVTAEGVSAYPAEVTPQMTLNFLAGGAAVNALARWADVRVTVVDIGVAGDFDAAQVAPAAEPRPSPQPSPWEGEGAAPHPSPLGGEGRGRDETPQVPSLVVRKIAHGTANMATGPAMSHEQAERAIEIGIDLARESIAAGADLLAIGEMGIGNTTAATTVLAALTGADPAGITGRGTGIDDDQLAHKVEVIRRALAVNQPTADDPLDVLATVGGFELGGMAGVVLAGAAGQRPVVVDGFIAAAAALIAVRLCPPAADYLILSHRSAEAGAAAMLDALGGEALLDLGMRLGEGTGACLAIGLIDAAVRCYTDMATFDSAAVSRRRRDERGGH